MRENIAVLQHLSLRMMASPFFAGVVIRLRGVDDMIPTVTCGLPGWPNMAGKEPLHDPCRSGRLGPTPGLGAPFSPIEPPPTRGVSC